MSISLEQFVQNADQSGLMSVEEITSFQNNLPAEQRPQDAKELGRQLIKQGKLTKFQATALYQGRTRGLLFGEYEILTKIGAGGMGQVYKARHRTMDRVVALKVLPAKSMKSPDAVQRFHREARAAAKLAHPNIVAAFDAGEHDGIHYLVMEYVEGDDLSAFIKKHGPLSIELAVACIVQAATGLEYSHQQGVVHRDIKPANLLLTRTAQDPAKKGGAGRADAAHGSEATVKILDMGLARVDGTLDAVDDETDHLTGTGQMMGTCDYMAPEQATDTHGADHRSDIYSLGCTLYRLLTGKVPYKGDSLMKILMAHQQAPVPSLMDAKPEIPAGLDALFQKMVAKNPEDRYQSMGEVIAALNTCLDPTSSSSDHVSERSTDGVLQSFLRDLPPAGAAAKIKASSKSKSKSSFDLESSTEPKAPTGFEETIDGQFEQETAGDPTSEVSSVVRPKKKKLLVGVGAGVVALTLLGVAGFMLLGGGGAESDEQRESADQQTQGQDEEVSQAVDHSQSEPDTGNVVLVWPAAERVDAKLEIDGNALEIEQAIDPTDSDKLRIPLPTGVHRVWMVRRGYEPFEKQVAVGAGQALTVEPQWRSLPPIAGGESSDEAMSSESDADIAASPTPSTGETEEPLPTEPPAVPKIDPELKRKQQQDAMYRQTLAPIEAMVSQWAFSSAVAELTQTNFEEPELMDRRNVRGRELQRLTRLKARMIAKINAPESPLLKSDLVLRGVGGDVLGADENAITASIGADKTEAHAWQAVSDQTRTKLLELVVDQQQAEDCLDAALLAFATGDTPLAEEYFAKARNLNVDIRPYLASLAAAAFDAARTLLNGEQFTEADVALEEIETKYAEIPWFVANEPLFDVARDEAKQGIYEANAEKLYAEAVELFKQKELFELRDALKNLEADYAQSRPMIDAQREPSFAEMEEAVTDLGTKLTVRQDGQGDFTSIQTAVDAAKPNSLIEIWDNGPYAERVSIPIDKDGLHISGAPNCIPIIISLGPAANCETLVEVASDRVSLNRLGLIHATATGECPLCLSLGLIRGTSVELTNVVFYVPYGSCVGGGGSESIFDLSGCLLLGPTHTTALIDSCVAIKEVWSPQLFQSTVIASVRAQFDGCRFQDSIIQSVAIERPCHITYCDILKPDPNVSDRIISGVGCSNVIPVFRDPANLDYRLAPDSPGTGMASDGGDVGCRYTPEMLELCQLALELRVRGFIKF